MAKVGVPQGTALAGLASIFRKGSSKKLTRSASSSSREFGPPKVKVKPNKKSSDTSSPDLSRLRPDPSSSPGGSRSSFKLFKKKKGRLSRGSSTDDVTKGSFEDLRSETSSLSSISRISIREEDAFEGNFPQKEVHSPFKELSSPLKESPLIPHVLQSESSGSISPKPTTTSTPSYASKPNTSLTVTSPTRKDRADSLFKDVSDLFGGEEDLFNSAELSSLLAKTKTEFVGKEATVKEEEKKKPSPVKPNTETKPPLPSQELPIEKGPSKPMRKNRSRVLNTNLYDQAAETAIKSTRERKSEREKERELEKKKEEEKRKPKISLFEELEEDEDLFGEKKIKKSEPEKTVISKDDLFDELEKPVNPVSTTKPKASSDSKTSERETEVKSTETKGASLFDEELEAEESKSKDKKDAVKALFGDDSDKFASKLSRTPKKSQEEVTKGASEPSFVEKSKLEIESEERKKTQNKTATKTNVFEDPLDSKKEPLNPKPPVTKKPSVPNPAHSRSPVTSPTRVKPPVISVKPKPKRVSQSEEGKQEMKKPSWKKELEEKDTPESKEADHMREKEEQKLKEEKLKQEEQKRKEVEEKAEKKRIEEEKVVLEKEQKRKEEEQIKEEKEKKRIEDEAKKLEEENRKKDEERKKLEDEKKKLEQEKKLQEEEKQKKLEEDKKKEEEAEKKKKIEEEKHKGEDKKQPDKQATPEMKRRDAEKKTETANEKPIPEWKRRADERKLQREKEEKESMAMLEERRKKREEQKATETTTTTTDKTSPTKSPEKSPIAKINPKPKTNSITITLSSSSNKPTEDTKDKSPVSPKEMSPTIDPSLPKWKQDLIARKKSGGSGPASPRRSTVSVAVEKKDDDLPAWKKELLAKKKVTPEVSQTL